jgi:hypothetical protein
MIGQFVSILHTTTGDHYFTSYVNNKVNAENDAWDMNQFDGFRDDSDCSRKVHFTSFYRTHGVEQSRAVVPTRCCFLKITKQRSRP